MGVALVAAEATGSPHRRTARAVQSRTGVRAALGGMCAAGCAAGCSDGARPSVKVEGGPLLSVEEGSALTAAVSLEPRATPDGFTVAVDPVVAAHFQALTVESNGAGGFELRVEPLCDLASAQVGTILVPVEVVAQGVDAEPARLLVQVFPAAGTACDAIVTRWLAPAGDDCATPAAADDDLSTLPLPRERVPQTLCVTARTRDVAEPLFVELDSDAPPSLLAGGCGGAGVETLVCALPLSDSDQVVGELEVRLAFRASATADAPVRVRAFGLRVGEPGDVGIDVPPPPRAVEFDVVAVPFTVHAFLDDPERASCRVRVERATAIVGAVVPRAKPFLRLYADGAPVEDASCDAAALEVRVSPPIDSPPAGESLRFEALVGGARRQELVVALEVEDIADELVCDAAATAVPGPLAACADLTGDGTPEVYVLGASGASCVFSAGAPVPWASTVEAPDAVLSFQSAEGAVVLAHVPSDGSVRRLVAGATAQWVAAESLGLTGADLEHALAIGPPGSAATHVAHLRRTVAGDPTAPFELALQCVVSSCTGEVVAPLAGQPSGVTLASMGGGQGDLDGDGDRDLLVGVRARTNPPWWDPTFWFVEVTWSAGVPSAVATNAGTLTGAESSNQLFSAVRWHPSATAHDDLYVALGDGEVDAVLLHILGAPSFFDAAPPPPPWLALPAPPPGGVRQLVPVGDGRVMTALNTGVWQHLPGASVWRLQDPVLEEQQDFGGGLPSAGPSYGRRLADCLGSSPAQMVFATSDTTFRQTRLDFTVGSP
jgi:hypothetical protein